MIVTKDNNLRLNWIDYAKGVGIILVVFGHVLKGLNTSKLVEPTFYYYAINFIYSFHMPLFFMLSGYFFLASFNKRGTQLFIVNKLETIAYPFLIWSVIQTVIEIKLSGLTNGYKDSASLIEIFYRPKDQFWFMFALFFINILTVIMFNISKKWGVVISIMLWIICYTFKLRTDLFNKTLINLIYFTGGIILSVNQSYTKQLLTNKYVLLINLVGFCLSLYFYFNFSQKLWYNQIFPQFFGCFIVIHVAKMLSEVSWLSFVEYLGINSMIIYLVHILAASGIRIILSRLFHITNSPIHMITGTLAGLIIPLVFYHFAKKTKYLLWLFEFPLKKKFVTKSL
ncbi:hypothetical protein A0256_21535 [Mucilaginibacter sp. PAMC 26640]|nr:hypothetical protein A0256_21535 [Mucilaginibacter sp. PAMC 26640]